MVRWISVACVAALASGCAHHAAITTDGKATVVRVVDGDTIVVHIGGHDENIRLLGIDTPETHKPNTPVECFGPEASDRLAALLPRGTTVRLVRDVEARDRYGRLLAYVYRDADHLFVDLTMLAEGYAGSLTIAPNVAHHADFDAVATEAQVARRGLWQACGGNHVPIGG